MWLHLLRIRRALRYRPLEWILKALLLAGCFIVLAGCWWFATSVLIDTGVQASQVRIDVLITPKADVSQMQQCVRLLRNRDDILVVRLLDSRAVWFMFQQELGMQAGGLSDVASMPSVVQLQLQPAHASLATAELVRNTVKSRYASIVDRVLIPTEAFAEYDKSRLDVSSARTAGSGVLFLVVLIVSFWLSGSFAAAILAHHASPSMGQAPRWGMVSVIGLTVGVSILAIGLGLVCLVAISDAVGDHVGWLVPFLDVVRVQ